MVDDGNFNGNYDDKDDHDEALNFSLKDGWMIWRTWEEPPLPLQFSPPWSQWKPHPLHIPDEDLDDDDADDNGVDDTQSGWWWWIFLWCLIINTTIIIITIKMLLKNLFQEFDDQLALFIGFHFPLCQVTSDLSLRIVKLSIVYSIEYWILNIEYIIEYKLDLGKDNENIKTRWWESWNWT